MGLPRLDAWLLSVLVLSALVSGSTLSNYEFEPDEYTFDGESPRDNFLYDNFPDYEEGQLNSFDYRISNDGKETADALLNLALLEDLFRDYRKPDTDADDFLFDKADVIFSTINDPDESDTDELINDEEDYITSDGKKQRDTQEVKGDGVVEKIRPDVRNYFVNDVPASSQDNEQALKSLLTELEDSEIEKKANFEKKKSLTATASDISMKVQFHNVSVKKDDTYLCTALKIDDYTKVKGKPVYIKQYIPEAVQTVAHHMLLYGCETPGLTEPGAVWDCAGLMAGKKNDEYPQASVCGYGQSTILWAWAKNAPSFHLPEGIGFKVGDGTNINYLVLNVHYKSAKVFQGGKTDNSAVTAIAAEHRMPKLAGVYVLATSVGTVPPHQDKNFDIYCIYRRSFDIHPFAFRTHTHALGKNVSGYRIRDGYWTLIGEKNPQLPEAFYPVANNLTIRYDDILAARCEMHNFRNVRTNIGYRHTDEMCNFYIMFWTDAENESKLENWGKQCSNGYPWTHWWNLPGYSDKLYY